MAWVAVAIGGGALLGAGATMYAAHEASDATQEGTQAALDSQWQMFQQQREDYAPWRTAGQYALNVLTGGAQNGQPAPVTSQDTPGWFSQERRGEGIPGVFGGQLLSKMNQSGQQQEGGLLSGPGEFIPEEQPGYKFGWQEFIEKPYLSQTGAAGTQLSGNTMKGLTRYAQDYASTSYDNFLNRYYQSLNPYFTLAGLGQVGTTGSANAASAYGQNASNLQYNNALAQGNYQTQMGAGLSGIGQNALNQYMNYKIMNNVMGGNAGGGEMWNTAYPNY